VADAKDDPKLIAEFDAFVARARLPVPPDRREGLIATFKEMRDMLDVLRTPLPHGEETAGTFDVQSVMRKL
jgi:hypothetical protein